MAQWTKRFLSLFLCIMMAFCLPFSALASGSAEGDADQILGNFTPDDLTPEELAQWEVWATEETPDTNAENAEALTPEEEAAMAALLAVMDDNPPMDEVDLTNLETNELLPGHVVNILLLGVDNRSVELEHGLSDAVIICSLNKETGSVKLTSIARDTAVAIPGFKNMNRINTAYRWGGAELSMKTVNRNFDMNIRRYVVVNIHGLAAIIDALGGIDLDMTKLEANRINFELRKEPMDKVKRANVDGVDGVQHLDGMQAVTFARIRNIDSDLERTGRQRKLLETLLQKVMADIDIVKLMQLIETALDYGQTNLTLGELVELGTAVLGGEAMRSMQSGGAVMEQMRVPMDKRYGYKGFNGVALLYLNPKNLKLTIEAIHEFIYGAAYLREP